MLATAATCMITCCQMALTLSVPSRLRNECARSTPSDMKPRNPRLIQIGCNAKRVVLKMSAVMLMHSTMAVLRTIAFNSRVSLLSGAEIPCKLSVPEIDVSRIGTLVDCGREGAAPPVPGLRRLSWSGFMPHDDSPLQYTRRETDIGCSRSAAVLWRRCSLLRVASSCARALHVPHTHSGLHARISVRNPSSTEYSVTVKPWSSLSGISFRPVLKFTGAREIPVPRRDQTRSASVWGSDWGPDRGAGARANEHSMSADWPS